MNFQTVTSFLGTAFRMVFRGGLVILMLVSLVRCTGNQVARENPEDLYQEAEEALKDEHFLQAIEKYRDLKNRYPYSSRAVDAELRIADAYFAQEAYLEAESAYEIFKELHPTHSRVDYVQYQISLSYFHQIPSNSARDLGAAYKAIENFQLLMQKYPDSPYSAQAKNFIVEARKKLAEHENYVADFYFRREHYLSASYRYAALLKDFPKLGYDEEALFRLGQCYANIRMFGNAKDALRRLISEYPQSPLKSSSASLLEELNAKN